MGDEKTVVDRRADQTEAATAASKRDRVTEGQQEETAVTPTCLCDRYLCWLFAGTEAAWLCCSRIVVAKSPGGASKLEMRGGVSGYGFGYSMVSAKRKPTC